MDSNTDFLDITNHFLWSTKRLIDLISNMSEEQFNSKQPSNTRSIREIILHLVSLYTYFSSFADYKNIVEKSKQTNQEELLHLLRDLSKKVNEVFSSDKEKVIPVKTKTGIIKNVTGLSLLYMLSDHTAYHRGQIITKYSSITGNESVDTDYAVFLQEDNPDLTL